VIRGPRLQGMGHVGKEGGSKFPRGPRKAILEPSLRMVEGNVKNNPHEVSQGIHKDEKKASSVIRLQKTKVVYGEK